MRTLSLEYKKKGEPEFALGLLITFVVGVCSRAFTPQVSPRRRRFTYFIMIIFFVELYLPAFILKKYTPLETGRLLLSVPFQTTL